MRAREWKPGDVALIEAGCWANRKVALRLDEGWAHVNGVNVDGDGIVSPVRPLVVIDPDSDADVARLENALEAQGCRVGTGVQAALREFANPTPPKPEEPTGLGAVVEDAEGVRWVRIERGAAEHDGIRLWISERDEDARPLPWSSIDAVRVLSEGVTA